MPIPPNVPTRWPLGACRALLLSLLCCLPFTVTGETLGELAGRVGQEFNEAYLQSAFAPISANYFARYHRNANHSPEDQETAIDASWRIDIPDPTDTLTSTMATHLQTFLREAMAVDIPIVPGGDSPSAAERQIVLRPVGGGIAGTPESYSVRTGKNRITAEGHDAAGLRDAIVWMVDQMGFREAPFLTQGLREAAPRLRVRLGAIPKDGTYRELIFSGYNAVFAAGGNLHALSVSDAIPALAERRVPGMLESGAAGVAAARELGLKSYAFLDTRQKYPEEHPVFAAHPEIRGARTWKADGEFVLCTEHPLVKQYLRESMVGLFAGTPGLNGVVVIIGGEGFYHCFMRPFGVEKGHTNCERCEALGPETVVANLCNLMAEAARTINPEAEVIAWPYSAEHVWSKEKTQASFIAKLKPGTGIFTEIEKDAYVQKEDGVNKHLWDYSIDMIGPSERAAAQIAACKAAGIPCYLKSEPELGFEAPRLPHIPAMDRWAERAEALASCGADGAWVFPAFRPNYGTSATEINKYFWWDEGVDKDAVLEKLAARIAGTAAAPHLRAAWKAVSEAIPWSPELPSYYKGPYYLGPAHPMCADVKQELPSIFFGYYLFLAEIADAEGLKKLPTFEISPTGNVPVFGRFYREMEKHLKQAVEAMETARPLVDERHRLMFDAEDSPIRWFYHTARTEANFYESCQLRDKLYSALDLPEAERDIRALAKDYERWREVLFDELQNAREAQPVMAGDVRLDFYFGSDHTFSHGSEMLEAKIGLLTGELFQVLPALATELNLDTPPPPYAELTVGMLQLLPAMFPQLPIAVRDFLEVEGYTVPQIHPGFELKWVNVIEGSFLGSGHKDWAVLGLKGLKTSILLFPNGTTEDVIVLREQTDAANLEYDKVVSSYAITVADKKYIMEHYEAYGGPTPPEITHDAINFHYVEKASEVLYFHDGNWIELQGAD